MNVAGASGSVLPASGLPVVNQALTLKGTPSGAQAGEPAWVRKGSPSTQKAYQTALAFEEMLVEELSKSLTATSGLEGESGQEGESSAQGGSAGMGASSSPFSSMLPQALTSSVMNAGGLGLAAQMTHRLEGASGGAKAGASGGAEAGASGGAEAGASGGAKAGALGEAKAVETGGTSA